MGDISQSSGGRVCGVIRWGGGDVFEEVQNRDGFYSLDLLDEEGNK